LAIDDGDVLDVGPVAPNHPRADSGLAHTDERSQLLLSDPRVAHGLSQQLSCHGLSVPQHGLMLAQVWLVV